MLKNELRKKYQLLRPQLSEHAIEEMSLDIANQLVTLPLWELNYFHDFSSYS